MYSFVNTRKYFPWGFKSIVVLNGQMFNCFHLINCFHLESDFIGKVYQLKSGNIQFFPNPFLPRSGKEISWELAIKKFEIWISRKYTWGLNISVCLSVRRNTCKQKNARRCTWLSIKLCARNITLGAWLLAVVGVGKSSGAYRGTILVKVFIGTILFL